MKRLFPLLGLLLATEAGAVVPFPVGFLSGRSTTPITPVSIPGLQAWFRADSFAYTNGEPVGAVAWTDLTGNGFDADQSTPALRPVFRTNVFGAQPAIQFDMRVDHSIQTMLDMTRGVGDTASLALTGEWTVMVVWKPHHAQTGILQYGGGMVVGDAYNASGSGVWGIWGINAPPTDVMLGIEPHPGSGAPSQSLTWSFPAWDTGKITTWGRDAAGNEFYRNDNNDDITTSPPNPVGTLLLNMIGANNNSGANRLAASIAELCIWNVALTDSQQASLVTNYFQPRYGL